MFPRIHRGVTLFCNAGKYVDLQLGLSMMCPAWIREKPFVSIDSFRAIWYACFLLMSRKGLWDRCQGSKLLPLSWRTCEL